jgi:hypothetical protein
MAEWSKAVDLRPTIVRCEGSNPSPCIVGYSILYMDYQLILRLQLIFRLIGSELYPLQQFNLIKIFSYYEVPFFIEMGLYKMVLTFVYLKVGSLL